MWSTWVRSCHLTPPSENSSWKRSRILKLTWMCPSSKLHNPCPKKNNDMWMSIWEKVFTKDSVFVYLPPFFENGHLWNCMYLRLKDQTDEMLDQFESDCADLASWRNWIANIHENYGMIGFHKFVGKDIGFASNLQVAPRSKPHGWFALRPRRWPMSWRKTLRSEHLGMDWHLAFFQIMRPWWTQKWVKFWLCQ